LLLQKVRKLLHLYCWLHMSSHCRCLSDVTWTPTRPTYYVLSQCRRLRNNPQLSAARI
jgi:hypothetical protein